MNAVAESPEQYLDALPAEHKNTMTALRRQILQNLPPGFKETMAYGMIAYVVPHSLYAAGYHCNPKQPLPFASIASQKNFVALYHMGLYSSPGLMQWFTTEYASASQYKLDMGKSCVRIKKPEPAVFELVGRLMAKMTVNDWVATYEAVVKA